MRPVVWSASSLNTYQNCHLAWWFGYVALEQEEVSEAKSVGMDIHEYAERRLKGEDFTAFLTSEVAFLAEVFDRDIYPTYRDPVLVETSFQIEIDGIPYSGIIDSLDRQDTPWGHEIILRDLKSTKSRPRAGKYRLALTGYWYGAIDLGFTPAAAQLDYIVRTKVPYYWPEAVEAIDEDDLAFLSASLRSAQDGVEAGEYSPTGLGTPACAYCGFQAICGPYQRYQEMTNPLREEAR